MRHLYQTPVVTVKGVADLLDIQSNTAAALIRDSVAARDERYRTSAQAVYVAFFEGWIY